jgi:hypothetical protein
MIGRISANNARLCQKSCVLLFVLVLAVSASHLTAQSQPQKPPSIHAETADFLGSVTEADKPLDGVHVTLTVYGPQHRATVTYGSVTNEKGRFSIPEVPAGTYEMELEKRGYLMVPPGKSGPVSDTHVRLKAGDRFTDVSLHMARRAIITGCLRDEFGQPMPHAEIAAKSARNLDNDWQVATTDDHGIFRLSVLPGKYLVAADASSRMRAEIQGSTGQGAYQFTYFPGVASLDAASLVEAVPGGTTADIDFKPIRAGVYMVKVQVTGIPEGSGNISIHWASGGDSPVGGMQSTDVEGKDGGTASFSLGPWMTGSYRLTAKYRSGERELQSPTVDVTIAASDVQGVLLPLAAELELEGTIKINGEPTAAGQAKHTVMLMPPDSQSFSLRHSAESGPDGTFRIADIAPGRYIVMIQPLPKNGLIRAVELNGSLARDRIPDLSGLSGVARLKIEISLDGAHISGKLSPPPVRGSRTLVVLVPRSEEPTPANVSIITPEDDGSYSFEGIAPGTYALIAFRVSEDIRNMPELLQRNRQAAIRLEVKEGATIVQDLKIISEEDNAPKR